MIILFTQSSWRSSRYEKTAMITAISSLIVMNSFCSVEHLLCVCFVTWLIQRQQSVHTTSPALGLMRMHKQHMHTNTHTHLGSFSTAGCAMSCLAQRLCAADEQPLPSPSTLCATPDTHTRIWLRSIEQLTTPVMNGTPEGRGCWERGGGGWPTKCVVIGGARSLITARLQLKVVHDSKHIFY